MSSHSLEIHHKVEKEEKMTNHIQQLRLVYANSSDTKQSRSRVDCLLYLNSR